jgi:predicted nuclease of restriction endonuclease-like (RecB) superfamily
LRGGSSVRQLDRQINSRFYEQTALSLNKAAMLRKGETAPPEDLVHPEEEIKDPFVLEFLGPKDEYSQTDLQEALIRHLETSLLELGGVISASSEGRSGCTYVTNGIGCFR